jgi:hypothetical protein
MGSDPSAAFDSRVRRLSYAFTLLVVVALVQNWASRLNYASKNLEILDSACLKQHTRVVGQSSSPLYVRNDLKDGFLSCATEVHAFR